MRLNIITGHFGSGKTEFAINYALKLKEKYNDVVICDMDIVNPYFRTSDIKKFLNNKGIKVISSEYASTNVDMPTLPGEILSVFANKNVHGVLDVGGDEDGAVALGRFHKYFEKEKYNMFLVVNALRLLTKTVEDIVTLSKKIEINSRLFITSVVNNTNISVETKKEHLLESMAMVNEAAKNLNVPVSYISGTKEVLDFLPDDLSDKKFALDLYMKLPF